MERGDAPGDGVVLSEVLPLLDVGGPDEEQADPANTTSRRVATIHRTS